MKLIEKIKANEPLYRALRTFIQAFIGAVTSTLAVTGFDNLTKKALISLLGSALASAVAAVMNMNKEIITTEDVMLEDVD